MRLLRVASLTGMSTSLADLSPEERQKVISDYRGLRAEVDAMYEKLGVVDADRSEHEYVSSVRLYLRLFRRVACLSSRSPAAFPSALELTFFCPLTSCRPCICQTCYQTDGRTRWRPSMLAADWACACGEEGPGRPSCSERAKGAAYLRCADAYCDYWEQGKSACGTAN